MYFEIISNFSRLWKLNTLIQTTSQVSLILIFYLRAILQSIALGIFHEHTEGYLLIFL